MRPAACKTSCGRSRRRPSRTSRRTAAYCCDSAAYRSRRAARRPGSTGGNPAAKPAPRARGRRRSRPSGRSAPVPGAGSGSGTGACAWAGPMNARSIATRQNVVKTRSTMATSLDAKTVRAEHRRLEGRRLNRMPLRSGGGGVARVGARAYNPVPPQLRSSGSHDRCHRRRGLHRLERARRARGQGRRAPGLLRPLRRRRQVAQRRQARPRRRRRARPPARLAGRHEDEVDAIVHLGAVSDTTARDVDADRSTRISAPRSRCGNGARRARSGCSRRPRPRPTATARPASTTIRRPPRSRGCARSIPTAGRSTCSTAASPPTSPPRSSRRRRTWSASNSSTSTARTSTTRAAQRSVIHQHPRSRAAGDACTLFRSHRPDIADGGQQRDFVWVGDCVDVVLWLLDHPRGQRAVQRRLGPRAQLPRRSRRRSTPRAGTSRASSSSTRRRSCARTTSTSPRRSSTGCEKPAGPARHQPRRRRASLRDRVPRRRPILTGEPRIAFPEFDPVAIADRAARDPLVRAGLHRRHPARLALSRSCIAERPPRVCSGVQIDDFLVWATLGIIARRPARLRAVLPAGYYLAHPLEIALRVARRHVVPRRRARRDRRDRRVRAPQRGIPLPARSPTSSARWCRSGCSSAGSPISSTASCGARRRDVPWAMVFPHAGGPLPRHPSQLYEAALEGLAAVRAARLPRRSRPARGAGPA